MEFIKMNELGKVEISIEDYNFLILRSKQLELLELGGVNSWEWYADSLFPESYEINYIEVDGEKLTGYSKLKYEFNNCNNLGE